MRQAVLQPAQDFREAARAREGRSLPRAAGLDQEGEKRGVLNPGEALPSMVEVKAPPLGPFDGTLVVDGYAGYNALPCRRQVLGRT